MFYFSEIYLLKMICNTSIYLNGMKCWHRCDHVLYNNGIFRTKWQGNFGYKHEVGHLHQLKFRTMDSSLKHFTIQNWKKIKYHSFFLVSFLLFFLDSTRKKSSLFLRIKWYFLVKAISTRVQRNNWMNTI